MQTETEKLILQKLDGLQQKVDDIQLDMNQRFDSFQKDVDQKFDSVNQRFDDVNRKLDTLVEEHRETREAVNHLVEWAEYVGGIVKFPLDAV